MNLSLLASQKAVADNVLRYIEQSTNRRYVHLYGRPGVGKGLIADKVFRFCQRDFFTVHFDGDVSYEDRILSVLRTLSHDSGYSGVIFRGVTSLTSSLTRLSDFIQSGIDPIISQSLRLDIGIFVILISDTDTSRSLSPTSQIYFPNAYEVYDVFDKTELLYLTRFFASNYADKDISVDDEVLLYIHSLLPQLKNALRDIKTVIERIIATNPSLSTITIDIFASALFERFQHLYRNYLYRGTPILHSNISRYIDQFEYKYHHCLFAILSKLFSTYFIDDEIYYKSMGTVGDILSEKSIKKVSFIRHEATGKSSPRVSHQLKNLCQLHIMNDFNLSEISDEFQIDHKTSLVLADDIIGSGNTLLGLLEQPFSKILAAKSVSLVVVALFAYHDAIERILAKASEIGLTITPIVGHVFTNKDKCLSEESTILNESLRAVCRELNTKTRDIHYPKLNDHLVNGYGNVGSLIVFSDTVPNNSLPILWYSRSESFIPLFPAHGFSSL